MNNPEELRKTVQELTGSCWVLTVLATAADAGLLDAIGEPSSAEQVAARCGTDVALVESMFDLLASLGFVRRTGTLYATAPALAAVLTGSGRAVWTSDLRSTLLQGHDFFVSGRRRTLARGWSFVDPDILEAQGANSAQLAELFFGKLIPMLAGMRERIERGARFLDVGSGVGSICVEFCRRSPQLRCVGLEPAVAPMQIARKNVAASGFADRIELRAQVIESIPDQGAFDLAWLPAVFLPEPVLSAGIARVHAALKAGGWVVTMAMSNPGDDLPAALGRLRNVMWGGDRLTGEELQDKLRSSQFSEMQVLPLASGTTKLIAARKAEA